MLTKAKQASENRELSACRRYPSKQVEHLMFAGGAGQHSIRSEKLKLPSSELTEPAEEIDSGFVVVERRVRHRQIDHTLASAIRFDVGWQIRPNAIWRLGRLFLACPACRRPATRLYVPTPAASPACRSC